MSDYLLYLLQVSGYFTLLYLVFYLFFRKLTFHKLNRIYLLLILILSILLPFSPTINNPIYLPEKVVEFADFEYTDLLLTDYDNTSSNTENPTPFNWMYLLTFSYWLGVLIAAFRFILSIIKLWDLKKNAINYFIGQYHFFIVDISNIFSFANWIFLPKDKLENKSPIIEHEKAHARLKHTIDIIALELYIMVCWFNPFVYFFRKSLRSIHEFQADEVVLKKEVKKSLYLSLLLNELSTKNHTEIYNYFNHPIIKSRVEMITKPSSKRKSVFRYLLLIPIFVLLLTAFTKIESEPIISTKEISSIQKSEIVFLFPIPNRLPQDITSPYGIKRKHPITKQVDLHGGIDIRAAEREPVIATADGFVSTATFKPDWGNLAVISHPNGYETWYAHLNDFEVKEGQIVKKGKLIGHVGNTGLSTAPHLHYEIRLNDERLNPLDFMEK